jgi:AdoMet-dependent rRNA methyltransferase SPB1
MFVRHPNPETIVETYGAITFRAEEDQQFAKSKHTTLEIQECCADIKSLNKTDKTRLLKWRRSLWEQYRQVRSKERLERGLANPDYEDEDGKGSGSEGDEEGDEGAADTGDKSDEDPMLVKMQRELDALRKQKAKQIKKKERKTVNSALQRAQRTNFNPDDNPLEVIAKQDGELFKQPGDGLVQERKLDAGDMDVDHISLASGSDADAMSIGSQSDLDSLGGESDLDSGPEGEEPRESNYYERLERILDNTFKEEKYERVGHREEVDPADPAPFVEVARGKGLANRQEGEWLDSEDSMSDTTVGGDSDDSLDDRPRKKRRNDDGEGRVSKSHKKIGFEEVPKMLRDPENRAKVLAIGTKMLDKKSKRDIMEAGWNRFSYNDDGLPKWFVEDEQKHVFVQLPVTKEEVQGERARYKEINARPARKVLEAMHRKYQKAKRAVGKIADKAKAAGGETLKNKSVPSVRDVIRSKDMRNSHKAKKPIDPKTLGDKKRERLKIAKQGRGKRKRFH